MRRDKISAFCQGVGWSATTIGEVIEYGNDRYRVTGISEFYIYVEFIDEFREAVRLAIER